MATHQCRFLVRFYIKPLSRKLYLIMLGLLTPSFYFLIILIYSVSPLLSLLNLPIDYAFQLHLRDRLTLFWFPFFTGTFVFTATSILTMFYVTHDNMLTSDDSNISYRHIFTVLQNALLPPYSIILYDLLLRQNTLFSIHLRRLRSPIASYYTLIIRWQLPSLLPICLWS